MGIALSRFDLGVAKQTLHFIEGSACIDQKTRVAVPQIAARLIRLHDGNFGDCRSVGSGVWELKIDWGPGYRVYYAIDGKRVVLLLAGGDKRTQPQDIARAIERWGDWQQRSRQ